MSNNIDFYLQKKKNHRDRKSVEAKHVKKLNKNHVRQATNTHPRFIKEKLLVIPSKTEVKKDVREYAKKKGVKIVRLRKDFH
jgi:hypothetical protein